MNKQILYRRINLGCGLHSPEGWINVDGSIQAAFARMPKLKSMMVALGIYSKTQAAIEWPRNVLRFDLRKHFPLPDGQFEAVYCCHTLEHLFHDDALIFLRECVRILRVGGVCRIVVPDLRAAVDRYLDRAKAENGDQPAANRLMDELLFHRRARISGLMGIYDQIMGFHQHKWMYDAESLRRLMEAAGFSGVTNPGPLVGQMAGLMDIENPARIEDGAGIVAEGVKA